MYLAHTSVGSELEDVPRGAGSGRRVLSTPPR